MAAGARPVLFAGAAEMLAPAVCLAVYPIGICVRVSKLAAAFPAGWLLQWGMSGLVPCRDVGLAGETRQVQLPVFAARWRPAVLSKGDVGASKPPGLGSYGKHRPGWSRLDLLPELMSCAVWPGLRAFPATDHTEHFHSLPPHTLPTRCLACCILVPVCVRFPFSLCCPVILRQVKSSIAWPNCSPTTSNLPKSPTTKCIK